MEKELNLTISNYGWPEGDLQATLGVSNQICSETFKESHLAHALREALVPDSKAMTDQRKND